jgi:hypothetical protein
MTAPAPRYRYTYAVPVRHDIIRGNTLARTVAEVRAILTQQYGPDLAEMATIEISAVEETT